MHTEQIDKIFIVMLLFLVSSTISLQSEEKDAEERIIKDNQGRIIINYLPMESKFRNEWPTELESGFWDRVNQRLSASNPNGKYGNTFFENEKQSYPNAFIDFVKGNRNPALKFLQMHDNDHWNKITMNIDWFACFTIRNQVRKYFLFGQFLDPAYKKIMFDSAKIWTEKDPLKRSNPAWQKKTEGWTPETMNSWVDVRNTDNLRAMRECAVYLMAEETGNKETMQIYRKRITEYLTAIYNTGMGEWDSANYLTHTMSGYIQLYDFAKDPEVKMLGKAAMDFMSAAGAVKYFRGSFGGPNKRDYNNIGPYAGAAGELSLYFGDCPVEDDAPYRDFIIFATSPYRPPEAVVHLARKNFKKPVEIFASKPSYEGWFRLPGGETRPSYFETTYIANTYQIGTLPEGHSGDINGFRLMTENSKRGTDTIIVATSTQGYKGISTGTIGGDHIAHFRNLVLWLNKNPSTPFYFLLPKSTEIETDSNITFVKLEKTWLALKLINVKPNGIDEEATKQVCQEKGKNIMPLDHVWSATGSLQGTCGFALEIGEKDSHSDYATFKKSVKAKSKLIHSAENFEYVGCDGNKVGASFAGEQFKVLRNGIERDWNKDWDLWQSADGGDSPITLGWKKGTLRVSAGGRVFEGTMKDGKYSFKND